MSVVIKRENKKSQLVIVAQKLRVWIHLLSLQRVVDKKNLKGKEKGKVVILQC